LLGRCDFPRRRDRRSLNTLNATEQDGFDSNTVILPEQLYVSVQLWSVVTACFIAQSRKLRHTPAAVMRRPLALAAFVLLSLASAPCDAQSSVHRPRPSAPSSADGQTLTQDDSAARWSFRPTAWRPSWPSKHTPTSCPAKVSCADDTECRMTFPCYDTSCRKRHNKASTGFCTCKGTLPPKDVQPNLKEKS
jgi:hypothetical protein